MFIQHPHFNINGEGFKGIAQVYRKADYHKKQAIIANLYFGAQARDIVNRSIGLELKIKLTIICVNTETNEAHVHVNGMLMAFMCVGL